MYAVFYKAEYGDKWDKLVAWKTKGKYSHVELMFSDGEWFSSSPRDGGTRFKKIDISDRWDSIYLNSYREDRIKEFCRKEEGCKYDWLGVVSYGVGIRVASKYRWFCSEICMAALGYKTTLISPNEMYSLLSNRLILNVKNDLLDR